MALIDCTCSLCMFSVTHRLTDQDGEADKKEQYDRDVQRQSWLMWLLLFIKIRRLRKMKINKLTKNLIFLFIKKLRT